MCQGEIVDATLKAAPSSTKTKTGSGIRRCTNPRRKTSGTRDEKVHIVCYKESGLIHSVVTTVTNVHDLTPAAELLHGASPKRLAPADVARSGQVRFPGSSMHGDN